MTEPWKPFQQSATETNVGLTPDVLEHNGERIRPAADFFEPAPSEIGKVISASSTLDKGKEPRSPTYRLVVSLVLIGAGVGLGVGINWLFSVEKTFWLILWPALGASIGAAIGYFSTSFGHTCTYVGEQGVALYRCNAKRENVDQKEVFLFDSVAELRTSVTRHYTNGVYQNTTYNFAWTDGSGRRVYAITGSHNDKNGNPRTTDMFHFARASERNWTIHLMKRAQQELDEKGHIRLNLHGQDHMLIGHGFIEFHFKGKSARCEAQDIEDITISQGTFTIKRKDAKVGWFRKDGVFQFQYAQMANAELFLLALEVLLGFKFN